ncbi:hypothetical protein ECPA39_4983 [Escherichia coli PA39]|nr:hypothetical protein ECPA39_4983 [Escherichia coli PA39]EIP28862.1 hypothetical protein ECEC4402_4942 [Escherichia coli EC4402]EKW26021.1 hypothetical protein EC951288_4607 [Escherichia coli 95.1288]EKY36593.1 hypothetical protein EC970010_4943 [Escherichia coli 97.0010]
MKSMLNGMDDPIQRRNYQGKKSVGLEDKDLIISFFNR